MSQQREYQTQNGFVLISGHTGQETKLEWQWLTQQRMIQTADYPSESYQDKKHILTNLNRGVKKLDHFQIRSGFSLNERTRMINTSCSASTFKKNKPYIYANTHS